MRDQWKVIWILASRKLFACKLWNPECWALESSIQLEEFLLAIGIQNAESTFHWQGIQNPVSRVQNPQHGIHNPRLSWITLQGAMVPLPSGGRGIGTPLYTGFVPFFEQKIQRLYKDFKGHFPHFSSTRFSARKSLKSMSFLVLSQHE